MSDSNPSKTKNKQDIDLLKSDIASFASTLGLSSSSVGFNDSDFRKTGPLKPHKTSKKSNSDKSKNNDKTQFQKDPKSTQMPNTKNHYQNNKKTNSEQEPRNKNETFSSKPVPKPPVLSLDRGGVSNDKFKKMPKLPLVKASNLGVWYVDAKELEEKVLGGEEKTGNKRVVELKEVEKKRELGERLLWQYVSDYEGSRGQNGDIKMLVATQRSGTAADKVSAFSVMVGDNPVANLRSLDALLGMVSSKVGKRHALTGFEALKELFISSLLPDRKLKTLVQRPLNNLPETKDGYSLLLFWYYEECLKQRYERFVLALEEASRDVLPVLKTKALKNIYALLTSKSEQEHRLLSALVNKLGDPQNKGASNADFHLSNLLSDHPNMKAVVITEVDTFLFRPHLGLRAKYHGVNFLSQIRLSHKGDGPKVAKRLIDVYFALFKVLITEAGDGEKMDKNTKTKDKQSSTFSKENKEKNSSESHIELDSRLLSALLMGVNRAFPYVSSNEADDIIEVQTPMLFKLVHSKNFNVGVQALMLLDKISSKNQIVSDRFYRALYSKLLLPAAMNSSKAEMFIGLLLRAMKNDVNLKRIAAFAKRVLQVALQQPPQYACGCLFLLSEVLKARPPLWNMVLQNESVDEEIEHFEDIVEETDNEPSAALRKEENNDKTVNGIHDANSDGESSEDEDDHPATDSEDDVSDESGEFLIRDNTKMVQKSETQFDRDTQQPRPSNKSSMPGGYDPRHREPSYCNADRASWWELMVLASHAHPSVATMAGTLLSGANIVYNGNPLNDLTLTAFLDKFMEKKPKQSTWHGGSQIEPAKKLDMNHNLIGPEILSLGEMDVSPEDLVFHKFYMNKMNSTKKPKKKKKKGAEDEMADELLDGGVGDDDSDNEEIENILDSSNPSLKADGDYDYDDLDQVANEDDEDLVGDVSDAEIDAPSNIAEGEDFDAIADDVGGDDDVGVDIGDAEDESDGEDELNQRKRKRKKRKRKSGGKSAATPFASLEDYEHLLNEDSPTETEPTGKKKSKSRKKKKSSK
ncbi:CCAAT/enhancer-binding protein zeta isoform X3 [Pistacia vera]|uniref:CCAAT/enhancer-binding protein zeta isoform X3 n=1 Tax=Pistacia vera TaxID=55513 RepID=UPI001262DBEE|nr:CCAAT/enhancer-binding protein zeta isoform X3 [Pistacia vera]